MDTVAADLEEATVQTVRAISSPAKTHKPSRFAMDRVALRMLTGDRAKFLSLIFAVAFATFLISQQA